MGGEARGCVEKRRAGRWTDQAFDDVPIGRDEALRVDDEAAAGLVERIGSDRLDRSCTAADGHLGSHLAADQDHGRLDAKDASLQISITSAGRTGRFEIGEDEGKEKEKRSIWLIRAE